METILQNLVESTGEQLHCLLAQFVGPLSWRVRTKLFPVGAG